jgi:hypothetical protein
MILASITLPVDAGLNAHYALKRGLCRIAGGFTAIPAWGAWFDPSTEELIEEQVTQYQVAVKGWAEYGCLSVLVHSVGRIGKQKAMYWTFDGDAFINDIVQNSDREAA